MKRKTPEATYRAEKAKRDRPQSHDQLMSEAKALCAPCRAAARAPPTAGRPTRGAAKPANSSDDVVDELGE